MKDAIDLSEVRIHNSPADIADWPITVAIERLEMRTPDGMSIGAGIPLTWDYHVPGWGNPAAGDDGNVLFTVWAIVHVAGQWHASGIIQMWKGRPSTGAPILTEWRNWAYARDRWGEMVDYVPTIGDEIGVLISAGSARNERGVTSVRQRSNVVRVRLPANDTGVFAFSDDAAPPPPPPRPGEPTPPRPAPADDTAAIERHQAVMTELATIKQQLATHKKQLDSALRGLTTLVTTWLMRGAPAARAAAKRAGRANPTRSRS